jgi:hypothetical protein
MKYADESGTRQRRCPSDLEAELVDSAHTEQARWQQFDAL